MAVRASEVDWIARQADWLIEEPPTKSAAVGQKYNQRGSGATQNFCEKSSRCAVNA
jgi:hypothetical protein